jgi:glycosyltransferase involved in cell wall biosynthesis
MDFIFRKPCCQFDCGCYQVKKDNIHHALLILGVCHISDLYPNVKYKIEILRNIKNIKVREAIKDLGQGGFYSQLHASSAWHRLLKYLWYLLDHAGLFFQYIRSPASHVYLPYPALLFLVLFSFFPRKFRPVIFADIFLCFYDTIVNDRHLLHKNSILAKILFRIERRAMSTARYLLVDTPENADFYSGLFDIALDRFVYVPLAIPVLVKSFRDHAESDGADADAAHSNHSAISSPATAFIPARAGVPTPTSLFMPDTPFHCLFIGSLVPLQGIAKILSALALVGSHERWQFTLIGDGQDSPQVEAFLLSNPDLNITWHRGIYDTTFLSSAILKADLCFGIFGDSEKASRVFPYKLYYYAALGKAFITADSVCMRRAIADVCADSLCENNINAIADRIVYFMHHHDALLACGSQLGDFYRQFLGRDVVKSQLSDMIVGCFHNHD